MKKLIKTVAFFMIAAVSLAGCKAHKEYEERLDSLEYRVDVLENLCKEMNTNISALQTLANVVNERDYITNITPITKDGSTIGYVITFNQHDPITIYNGDNGTDGSSASAPVIGVAKDTDGVYYWTINGSWLLDEEGHKLRVTGNDGPTGATGVTPQLKIESGDWYVSYDNGATWTYVGQATGNTGATGEKGDSMFQSVTYDANYVYFVLTDGTTLVVNRGNNLTNVAIVDGTIQAPFSVSATKQVYFAMGNLQYQASTKTWRFAENQYDTIGALNKNISSTYDGWIDLFGWGTSGWNSGAQAYQPYSTSTTSSDYYPGGVYTNSLTGTYANADWGVYNAISNGGNKAGIWRTPTKDEWNYLINSRANAAKLYSRATVCGIAGLLILPDGWTIPEGIAFIPKSTDFESNNYSTGHWAFLQKTGAVFLPCGGNRRGTGMYYVGTLGNYWSSTYYGPNYVYNVAFNASNLNTSYNFHRYYGRSVRLVQDVE